MAHDNTGNGNERTVRVKIERTKTETEPVFVSVNNRTYFVKRGTYVDVPESVAEVLSNRDDMLDKIIDFAEANKLPENF